ncbi:MAG TPA: hypothetical protein VHQ22_12250 [Terriglobales bacterium]|jgi:hypothetical protein|nr:hypothetical protein [Terriglobales bacterium]
MSISDAFNLKFRRHTVRPWRVSLAIQPLANLHATQLTATIPESLTVDIYLYGNKTVTVGKINRDRLPFGIKMLIAILY